MGKLAFVYLSKNSPERLAKLRALGRDEATTVHERNLANSLADELETRLIAEGKIPNPKAAGPFKAGDMVRVKPNHPILHHQAKEQGLQFKIQSFSPTQNRYSVYYIKDGKIITVKPIHGDYLELA